MIEPLRRVHVAAFRALGQAIGATRLTVCDSMCDDLLTAFVEGAGTADCIALLHASMGPPQHSIEAIRPEFVKQAENRVPSIWFTEPLPTGPKNW